LTNIREKGFTLIEMLIVLAITGAIVGPLAMATTTLLTSPQRSTDQNVVLSQVQNTGYWISRDVQMARTVTPSGPTGFPLSFKVPVDDNEDNDLTIDYSFDGSKLKREFYDSSPALISETLIADCIATANTTFIELDPCLYKLTVMAVLGDAVVTRSYEVEQRVSPY
jgi:prepilin-type N-terminal cleavage/methylation domain-containing protein